ncbi:unnamed protein product [Coregonus sp. 'balchen']|nr:unnamed protein product [Coregonus sp. 'balchen']
MPGANPFKVLDNNNLFLIRNKEKERRKLELQSQLGLRVHEKVTYAGRMKAKQGDLRRELREGLEEDTAQPGGEESRPAQQQNTPAWRYSLAVKRGEIEHLEKMAAGEERKLMRAERFLEDDAIMFDEFLKENDKNSVEAIKVAELETKVKLEKVTEIKRLTTRMVTIKKWVDFLFKLSPPEWQEAQKTKTPKAKSVTKDTSKEKDNERATPKRRALWQNWRPTALNMRQLLELLTELEEQNLSLIQNSRETEEALEVFSKVMDHTRKKMELETIQLTQQIDIMTHTIQREKERAAELELRARLFNFGKYKSADQVGERKVALETMI